MSLEISQKKLIIDNLKGKIDNSFSIIVMDYKNIRANDINVLRRLTIDKNFFVKAVRNKLAKLSLKDTKYNGLTSHIKGNTIISCYYLKSINKHAKIITDFLESLDIKDKRSIIAVEGRVMEGRTLKTVSNMPSFDSAIFLLYRLLYIFVIRIIIVLKNIIYKIRNVLTIIHVCKVNK